MSVKLLQKSELSNLKAKAQQRDINEGEKVAIRVDNLRKLWAKTEQDFEVYKNSTLQAIQKDILDLELKKEKLIGETRSMQSKYDSMLPEMSLKRTELAQFEKSLKTWEKKLEKREETSALSEIDVLEALDAAQSSQIMKEDNERITRNLLKDADKKKNEANQMLLEIRNFQEKTRKEKREVEETLNLRELAIESKEKELSRKAFELINKEKELEEERVKVADRQATLERALGRLKAGRRA